MTKLSKVLTKRSSKPGSLKKVPKSNAARVQKHRDKLRAAGLKPVQLWSYDTSRPGFAEECRRQSLLLQNDPQEAQILDEIEAMTDYEGWK